MPSAVGVVAIVFGKAPTNVFETSCVPSGFRIETNEIGTVIFVSAMDTGCPERPVNVARPFWPGVPIVIVCGAPPTVRAAEASAGTSYSVTIAKPVASLYGSIVRVYGPVAGNARASTNVSKLEKIVRLTTEMPFGTVIET